METGGIPAGSARALRLDPFALPVRYPAQDSGADGQVRQVELHREHVVLRRAVRGMRMKLGPTAALRRDDVSVVVTSKKVQAADMAMFVHLGLDPAFFKIVALKSSVHFRAHFQKIAEKIIVVAAPGPNPADPSTMPWTRLRKGIRLKPKGPAFGSMEIA